MYSSDEEYKYKYGDQDREYPSRVMIEDKVTIRPKEAPLEIKVEEMSPEEKAEARQKVYDLAIQHEDVPFVHRLLDPAGSAKVKDETDYVKKIITLDMVENGPGMYQVFPTSFMEDGDEWYRYTNEGNAREMAEERGDIITFDNEEDAEFLVKHYPCLWFR